MGDLTYKRFLDQVRFRLDELSELELRDLILNWARKKETGERKQFLEKLKIESGKREMVIDRERFLASIKECLNKLQEEAYYTWSDEDQTWGDQIWAGEMDQFFRQTQQLVRRGHYALAVEAYQLLFEILEIAEEPGYLSDDANAYDLLSVDILEQEALFFRSLYTTWEPKDRPGLLWSKFLKFSNYFPDFGLREIIESVEEPLPDQEAFLNDWIQFLSQESGQLGISLMEEAVNFRDGLSGLIKLARQDPASHAQCYLDGLNILDRAGKREEVLAMAQEALERIPDHLTIRAPIAAYISREGKRQNNVGLLLKGYRASFFAAPKLESLLDLYSTALENNSYESMRKEVLLRIEQLRRENPQGQSFSSLGQTTALFDGIYYHSLILSGEYEQLFPLSKGKSSLGWSGGNNPKPFLLLCLLSLLSQGSPRLKVLNKQWERLINAQNYLIDQELSSNYLSVFNQVYQDLKPDQDQTETYLQWCREQAEARLKDIVSNKYRKSYYKAAELIVSIAETLTYLNRPREATALIQGVHDQYRRFSALRRELRQAVQETEIL